MAGKRKSKPSKDLGSWFQKRRAISVSSNSSEEILLDNVSDDEASGSRVSGTTTPVRTETPAPVESLFESRKDSPTITTFKSQSVLKSWVWQHYTKISEAKTECNYCQKLFIVSGTGTMSKHIHAKHSTKITHATQSTLNCSAKIIKPFKFDAKKSHFIKFIVTNNHAFTLGEEPDFQAFLSTLQPLIEHVWRTYNFSSDSPTTINGDPEDRSSSSKSEMNRTLYIAEMISVKILEINNDELKQYMNEETEPRNCKPSDVFRYWAHKSTKWPKLSCMARDMMSIPATSAASERAFSTGKNVFGIARMSLSPETVEALVCLRSWYRAGLIDEVDWVPMEQLLN